MFLIALCDGREVEIEQPRFRGGTASLARRYDAHHSNVMLERHRDDIAGLNGLRRLLDPRAVDPNVALLDQLRGE